MSERWVWDRFWQADRIACCFDVEIGANYDASIAEGWRTFFASLPGETRIIDLCTGNGAIALLAATVGLEEGKNFSITAVDQADIDPPAYVSRNCEEMAAIQFAGCTDAEALPFADGSFDVAVSQYGLEYCELARAVPEMVRILAPGGEVRLVVHATEGRIATNAKAAIVDAEMLLKDIDLVGVSRRCLEAVATVERGNASPAAREQAEAAFETFRNALNLTHGYVPKAFNKGMVRNSGGVLLDAFQARHHVGYDAVFAKVDTVESEILAHRGRIQALVDSALDEGGLDALKARLEEAGAVKTDRTDLRKGQDLIGYVLTASFA